MIDAHLLLHLLEGVVLSYTAVYLVTNLGLILAGAGPALDQVRERGLLDLDQLDGHDSTLPRIALVVSAYNEEKTIVESIRSFMAIDYPALELVIVDDGSTDGTTRAVRQAFSLRRRDVPIRDELQTAEIRAIYEARPHTRTIGEHISRFVLVQKENGGRADGLNAGIRVARSPLVLTVDADCIIDPTALKQLVRQLQTDPEIVAIGGQIGVVNDCEVQDGQVVRPRVPGAYLPLCQTVEYLRAFSVMRTGFSRLGSLLILSGAFMLVRRDVLVDVGGFLTRRSQSKLLEEYVGSGTTTICEDMEVIVRTHRHLRERGRRGRIVHAPVPLVWTEVPPTWDSLSKQRRRWHRGLMEILSMHRTLFLDPRYGRAGTFAFPYFFWFEGLGPWLEALGLFLMPILALVGWLDPLPAALVTAVALGAGVLQSITAVAVSAWMEPTTVAGNRQRSLIGADTWRDRWLLLVGCFLSELGYRQMTVLWRLRATLEFFRGYQGWDKFERKGFRPSAPRVAGLALAAAVCGLVTVAPAMDASQTWDREATWIVGSERRDGRTASWWTEAYAQWNAEDHRSHGIGLYWIEREGRTDRGVILTLAPPRFDWGGVGLEVRAAPEATFSPLWAVAAETEFAVVSHATGSIRVRESLYEDLSLNTWMLGTVIYLRHEIWWSHHLLRQTSDFSGGADDRLWGYATRLHVPLTRVDFDLSWQTGGESYRIETQPDVGNIRARVLGLKLSLGLGDGSRLLLGIDHRVPERGVTNWYLHGGVRRGF